MTQHLLPLTASIPLRNRPIWRKILAALASAFFLSHCASTFDKTHLLPGQRIPAQGFSFAVPMTPKPWFAVQYGNSHLIHLSQVNNDDSYQLKVSTTKGPPRGMYKNAKAHMQALKRTVPYRLEKGFELEHMRFFPAPEYGSLCVGYEVLGKNWYGRARPGPASIEIEGLSCPHKFYKNVLIHMRLMHRYEPDFNGRSTHTLAKRLFSSIEYEQ